MNKTRSQTAARIRERRSELAARITATPARIRFQEDRASELLLYLIQALDADAPGVFLRYLAWLQSRDNAEGRQSGTVEVELQALRSVLEEVLPEEQSWDVLTLIGDAQMRLPTLGAAPPSHLAPNAPLADLAARYLEALLAGDRASASQLILTAADGGVPVKDLYQQVFQPVQWEIGRLWQYNRISVAQEHFCTAATQLVMSLLYPRIIASGVRTDRAFVAACVSGELHEIGVRMVADFFELDGWTSHYLGASTPAKDLVRTLIDRKARVLGLSATMTQHVDSVANAIRYVRQELGERRLVILVGGYPFTVAPDLWRRIGADGSSASAQAGVDLANTLTRDAA